MDEAGRAAALAEIRRKLALLKQVEAEHGFGVVIEEQTAPLEPIPELPAGVIEVYRVVRRLEGSYFRFRQPPEIASPAAFRDRELVPYDLLGHPLSIGWEIRDIPADLVAERDVGQPIYLDVDEGYVYHVNTDEYVLHVKGAYDGDIEVDEFAPDIVSFFDTCVLGPDYPDVVETVCGPFHRDHRVRKGRFKGQYTDTWLRLLVAAGLAS
ncbi:hypothetical protein [Plantactinospora sonchi]|uniref:Knr4/Smi1-like domain-containing protein n=1 Tax=Plantactinospora sonchi TaxID=1544735 RepID=A0ABU7RTA7_9ACTN